MTDPASFRLSGAVDLGGLRQPPPATATSGNAHVVDVSEATFQTEVVERSKQVPVVLDFWASWCGPCKQLSPVLEKLAGEGGGRWVLAKIDVDANQRLAAAFAVQGIPAVKAVVDGQAVDLFTGAVPEAQVRQVLEQLLALAAQRGMGGADPSAEQPPSPSETALAAAYDALSRGDIDAAEQGLREVLTADPNDVVAKAGLAQVTILRRAQTYDEPALMRQLSADEADVEANLAVADLEVLAGQPEAAFSRLLRLLPGADDEPKSRLKERLLALFDALDPGDPAVLRARRELANALF